MSRMPSTSIGTRQRDVLDERRVVDLVAERVALRRQDRRRARPSAESGTGSFAPRIERHGHQADEVFVAEVLDDETRIRHRLGHDRARELALGDLHREPLGRAFGESQRQRGRDPAHLDDQRGHERPAHRSDDAEGRVPGLEALQHREVLAQRLELTADRPGPVEHPDPELGGHGAPAAAHEQLHAQLGLELMDVPRHVRLHCVEAVGRRGERPFFGHCEQRLELAKVHADPPRPLPAYIAR